MIRHTVRIGQEWQSNDPRRFNTVVRVVKILGYESGQHIDASRVFENTRWAARRADRVQVENIITGKTTTIRRDQFTTGVRGWSLFRDSRREEMV